MLHETDDGSQNITKRHQQWPHFGGVGKSKLLQYHHNHSRSATRGQFGDHELGAEKVV